MTTHGQGMVEKLGVGITTGQPALNAKMQSIGSMLENTARSFANNMTSIGQQMVDGLINGINNRQSALVTAMQNAVNAAVNSAKSTLQIASPSKVMERMGLQTGEGFAVGLVGLGMALSGAAEGADVKVNLFPPINDVLYG